jgi:hypothetical protein
MVVKLVRRARISGYRPTRAQLEEMLELAQRGIDDADAKAHLSYWQGNREITPQGIVRKVLPSHLDEIIKDVGPEARELSNLSFDISQDAPIERAVTIQIGPEKWTTYEIRSDDQTWALGRYQELTGKLLKDRNLYSKGCSSRPQVPLKGAQGSWTRSARAVNPLRVDLVLAVVWLSFWALPLVIATFAIVASSFYYSGNDKTQAGQNDHQNALNMLHWASANWLWISFIVLSYLLWLKPRHHWVEYWQRSAVVLKRSPILSQFSLRANSENSVLIGTFYVTVALLIVGVIAII